MNMDPASVLQALVRFRKPGDKVKFWRYDTADGALYKFQSRISYADGGKTYRPISWDGAKWVAKEPPPPPNGKPLYRLRELQEADPSIPVCVAEGEKCAVALASLGLLATTSGSASSAGGADWSPLAGRRQVILFPDHDAAGARYAGEVADALAKLGQRVERVDIAALGLPEHGDIADWIAANEGATAEQVLSLPRVTPSVTFGSEQGEDSEAPRPLPNPLPPVPAFELGLVPETLRALVEDTAEGLQVPPEFVAVPLIAAAGGVIGRQVCVALKQHERWTEHPILWALIMGRPSSGKSPALRPALKLLSKLEEARRAEWQEQSREASIANELRKEERLAAKDTARKRIKGGDREGAHAALSAVGEDIDAPGEPRLLVNDATIEKLGEILSANPRGIIQTRDELAGWMANLDRDGREGDRAAWLEFWNGKGAFTCDRIGRGSVRIEAPAVSIIGGVQPGKLAEYVRGAVRGGSGDDGLLQRFQLAVYPDLPAGWRYVDRAPAASAEALAKATFERLDRLDPAGLGAHAIEGIEAPVVRLGREAQELFVEWQTALMLRLRTGGEPPHLESHFAKYPALVGRLALTLHLAGSGRGDISPETLATALDWCGYLEPHARRIYAPATDDGLTAAHLLLRKRDELPGPFSARELYRKGWAGLDRDSVGAALEVLVDHGHLRESIERTGGHPLSLYVWRAAP